MSIDVYIKKEIENSAREIIENLYKPTQLFASMPEVLGVRDLMSHYDVTDEVVYKMIARGMPHTHAGREFRFHRALLIEWTRGGETPFPCASCDKKKQKDEIPKENISNFPTLAKKTDEKLASMVR